jgi:flavin reductase (DIM6/NTAB) family NADH-FMN oxidoreductase RutF
MNAHAEERGHASLASEGNGAGATNVTEAFLAAFRHHPSGVAIITADAGDGPAALTVSSLISVSLSPPTVAFSLSDASSSARTIGRAETLVVHFVRRSDMQLARLCATSGKDRFGTDVNWSRLAGGEPYYPQVDIWFRAAIREQLPVPGARLVTAELLSASQCADDGRASDALVYANRSWHGLHSIGDAASAPLFLWPDDSATF